MRLNLQRVNELAQNPNFSFIGLSLEEMLRNGVIIDDYYTLLPFPANSLQDGALRPQILPDIMQNLNNGLNYALDLKANNQKDFAPRHFSLIDEIKIVYIECIHAIEKHKITDKDLTAVDYSMKIIENKMSKLGINSQELKNSLEYNKKNINRHFYSTQLDNGDRVFLSKGVAMIAILQNEELDFTFINECLPEKDVIRCYLQDEIGGVSECYISNPQFSDRLSMDFSTIEKNDEILHNYAVTRNLKPLSEEANKQVFNNLEFAEENELQNQEYQHALRFK